MSNISNMTCAPFDICGDKGLLLPFMPGENLWPLWFRAAVYLLGLLWCFLGVAIIADVFMCSIEKITSRTRTIRVASNEAESGYEEIEVKVWNDTVANLTLMALGSSAPEILLSCIEIVGNGFKSGELGPSTIVGSAAFNLLVITAVCIMSIETPDIRRIKAISVFGVTAFFSVFAYVWLIIILVAISPEVVELWEAIITFLFFPVLVILAYLADRNFCMRKPKQDTKVELGFELNAEGYQIPPEQNKEANQPATVTGVDDSHYIPWLKRRKYTVDAPLTDDAGHGGRMTESKMRDFIKELRKIHPNLSEEEIAQLAAAKLSEEQNHSRLWYRINATRNIAGGHKLMPTMSEDLNEVYDHLKHHEEGGGELVPQDPNLHGSFVDISEGGSKAVIEFTAAQTAILENEGRVRVGIRRYGKLNTRVIFKIETIDGTAEAGSDYKSVKKELVFAEGETYTYYDIEIIDDNEWEPDEVFFVKLSLDPNSESYKSTILGKKAIQEITIINDDNPGTFEFSRPSLLFKESAGKALIPVERRDGADGKVTLTWRTEDMTAHSGRDYEGGEGTLIFEHGEIEKTIEIIIHDDQEMEKDECFKVDLLEVSEGAKLGRVKKTIVTIVNDDDFNGMVSRLVDMTNTNMDALRVESHSYTEQFRNAMNVNGGELEGATHMDYVMHFCTFAWKILFAIVPPVNVWGGWLSFFIALGMIGLLTAIVGDLAGIFGCLIGLEDSVTAITFVALGTSLPDLFASKQSATQEKTADNSIGNVTGSNSVNVFLGLGLPWLIASIYWTAQNKQFEVERGSLTFSVVIYTLCACTCIALLFIRRTFKIFGGGELGGTKIPKIGIEFKVRAGVLCYSVLIYSCLALFCIILLMCRRTLSFFGKAELGGTRWPRVVSSIILVCCWLTYIMMSSLQAYDHVQAPF